MLLGNYISQLGSGKRVAVPKKFRSQLGATCVVAKWYDKCLVLLSEEAWSELLQRLTVTESIPTAAVRDTMRFVMGSAFEVSFDHQGRFVLPDTLLGYAGIKDEVIFLGLGERIEIWDKNEWETKEQNISENAGALLEQLADGK
jgi:MraZ protein